MEKEIVLSEMQQAEFNASIRHQIHDLQNRVAILSRDNPEIEQLNNLLSTMPKVELFKIIELGSESVE